MDGHGILVGMSAFTARHRASFTSLALPNFDHRFAFYLNSVAGLEMGAESAIRELGLVHESFVSREEEVNALKRNSIWVWEEMSRGEGSQKRRVGAASSLPALLAPNAPEGGEEDQRLAAELFEQLFLKTSLCFNDFLETGHEIEEFAESEDVKSAFYGDKGDMEKAVGQQSLWTMVDMTQSQTIYAASSLEGVLGRAWDNDPRLVIQNRLDQRLPQARAPHKSPRSGRM